MNSNWNIYINGAGTIGDCMLGLKLKVFKEASIDVLPSNNQALCEYCMHAS